MLTIYLFLVKNLTMEDSMELPSQIDNQQINFFVSPNNSMKKHSQQAINTASQQSLAYSSETHARYQTMQRSPIQIQMPNFQSSERPASLKKMIRAANAEIDKSPTLLETRSEEHLFTAPSRQEVVTRQDRRKTINKKQNSNMSKKYKQIEYALQVQVINSEQLRTKVSILTELLQQKLRDSDLSFIFSLKNSSRNMKNVDIFVQLKQSQKKLKQTQLTLQQYKQQVKRLTQQSMIRSSKKQNMNLNNIDPMAQMQALQQEKQSLFNYIEDLRKQYSAKNNQYKQVLEELQRCQEKQHMFVNIQRPKLIKEISERTSHIKQLQNEIQQLRMENNLIQLKLQTQIQENQKNKKCESNQMATMTAQNACISTPSQTNFEDFQMQILKSQLKLLKSERDYYMQEFKKKISQSSQNYLLKLQLKAYEACSST